MTFAAPQRATVADFSRMLAGPSATARLRCRHR